MPRGCQERGGWTAPSNMEKRRCVAKELKFKYVGVVLRLECVQGDNERCRNCGGRSEATPYRKVDFIDARFGSVGQR
jgi:hypothetical protein